MLRGGAGSRGGAAAAAKPPRCPHPRPLSRRARATAAAPESKGAGASVLEDPVVSSVEESSFTFEFKRGSKRARKSMPLAEAHRGKENCGEGLLDKPNVVPPKTPVIPQEVEFTHCAPSIVARLMGLDTVPRSKKVLDRCQSDIQSNMRLKLSGGGQEVARLSCDDLPCRSSADELPELKDVFEVTDMEKMAMRKALQSGNEMPRPRSNDADLEFVRRKFLDAKRLSTDEGRRNSKEFGEALEILYSKKDVFLEILQESSTALSGFPGHILGYSGLQGSPHTSNGADGQDNLHRMEVECESEDSLSSMHLKEGSKSSGKCSHIVVLKPDPRRKSSTPVLSSQEIEQFGQWTGTQWLKPPRCNMYKQDFIHSTEPRNFQFLEPEGATPEQKVRKQTAKRGSRRKPSGDELYLAVGCQREKVASASHDETLSISSSTHSAGSSVSRKARKHLSERWQLACQSNVKNSVPTDTRTLGEMLELTRDVTKVTTHKNLPDPNSIRSSAQETPASPLGISSKDGWKTGIYHEDDSRGGMPRNFPRSKSLPASSNTVAKLQGRSRSAPCPNLPILKDILNTPTDDSGNGHVKKRSPIRKARQKNGRVIVHVGKENMLAEKEIYVTSEKTRHSICTSDLPRPNNTEHPLDVTCTDDHAAIDLVIPHDDVHNLEGQIGWTEHKLATSLPEPGQDITIHNQDTIALKEGKSQLMESSITEIEHQAVKSTHTLSSESYECLSPVASPQHSSGEEAAYSGIFKSVNDGIQELRAQLKMLKMGDQVDTCRDDSDAFSSDECNDTDISDYQVKEELLPVFKDEEDRDCSYVQEMLGTACDSPVYPQEWQFSSDVFLWLENKYSKLLLWSKSDRKHLFDLVNSILADMTAPGSNLCSRIMMNSWPEMDWKRLAENVWQTALLARRSYQPFDLDSVQPLPLDHHPELGVFGTEIAEMIHGDVLEELVAELVTYVG
ncbi:unnamed protein product [Alopecurus aequalis]